MRTDDAEIPGRRLAEGRRTPGGLSFSDGALPVVTGVRAVGPPGGTTSVLSVRPGRSRPDVDGLNGGLHLSGLRGTLGPRGAGGAADPGVCPRRSGNAAFV